MSMQLLIFWNAFEQFRIELVKSQPKKFLQPITIDWEPAMSQSEFEADARVQVAIGFIGWNVLLANHIAKQSKTEANVIYFRFSIKNCSNCFDLPYTLIYLLQ